jgi:hypothetical protein
MNHKLLTCPAAAVVVVAVTLALAACSGSAAGGVPAANGGTPAPDTVSPAPGDCLLGAHGVDVEVGVANPTDSCANWIHNLDGAGGLVWYPIKQMAVLGSEGAAPLREALEPVCDLADGTQELYVEDSGEQIYGLSICSVEEVDGWRPEKTPGPLALHYQQAGTSSSSSSRLLPDKGKSWRPCLM